MPVSLDEILLLASHTNPASLSHPKLCHQWLHEKLKTVDGIIISTVYSELEIQCEIVSQFVIERIN